MNRTRIYSSVILCGFLAACGDRGTPSGPPAVTPDAASQAPDDASTSPVEPVPPAANLAAPRNDPSVNDPGVNDPSVIGFHGFGPATFGANEEAVRIAWGYPLEGGNSAAGSTCRYLRMDPPPAGGRGIAFMLEDKRFVRYDVDVDRFVAPGDLIVGDDAARVRATHAGRIEEQPHKYVQDARVLIVTPADGGEARLVFEIDASGKIGNWRIGVPPQVLYVEGCG